MRPLTAYPGGKTRMAEAILKHAPPHEVYLEPFAGGASVFWAKDLAKVNVLADLDPQVVALYKGFSCPTISSCVAKNPPTISNRQKAVEKFRAGSINTCDIFLARSLSFNGAGGFGSGITYKPISKVGQHVTENCATYSARLSKTKVVQADFRKAMEKYDSKKTFTFLDPPYPEVGKRLYRFNDVTPEEVCGMARKAKGKVLITYPDTKAVRGACKGLHQKTVPHVYTNTNWRGKGARRTHELLIANYPLTGASRPTVGARQK